MEIKDWITIIGIGLTFVVSLISLYFSLLSSRKTLFINSITASRIKWISDVRENISKFCGLTFHFAITDLDSSEKQKVLEEIDRVRFVIKLQLNREDKFDKKIIDKIDVIPTIDLKNLDMLEKEINELIELTQDLLKLEWEGAKLESTKGIISKKKKDKLYEKYLKMEKASR